MKQVSKCPSKNVLEQLYNIEKKSTREIGFLYNVNKDTIAKWLAKNNIPRRTTSEATSISSVKYSGKPKIESLSLDEIIDMVDDKIEPVKYVYTKKTNLFIPISIKTLETDNVKKNITLTICLSDLHLGHEAHLPDTYWSTIENLKRSLMVLKEKYNIKSLRLICNGDLVSGTDVYRFQELNNLVQRGHWMVFLAERVIKKTIEDIEQIIPIDKVFLIKGNHENRGNNYNLYLRKALGNKSIYSSKGVVLDIGNPIGNFNVFFTHGSGGNSYFPVSLTFIRDLWKVLADYKSQGIIIERVVSGHTHWLAPDIPTEGMNISVTGGFQKWEYSIAQRPCGLLLLMYCDDECSVIPIRPDEKIEQDEKCDASLEYKNMGYYAKILREHLQLYESNQGVN